MEKAIETSIEATKFAHDNGLEVVFFPIDFSRAEINWALDLIEKVGKEGHMDALALVDTFGVVSPHAMKYFVSFFVGRIFCGEPVPTSPENAPCAVAHQEAARGKRPPGLRHGRGQHHHGAVARARGRLEGWRQTQSPGARARGFFCDWRGLARRSR